MKRQSHFGWDATLLLAEKGEVRLSEHGYNELAADCIFVHDVVVTLKDAELIEDYPEYPKGPCILLLQRDQDGEPIHAVWGIPKGKNTPAVLVTAYRPDPAQWQNNFRRRKV